MQSYNRNYSISSRVIYFYSRSSVEMMGHKMSFRKSAIRIKSVSLPRQFCVGVFQREMLHNDREGMMEISVKIPDGQNVSMIAGAGHVVLVGPEFGTSENGKSVEYALPGTEVHWFPIRATYHRAQKVYDRLVALEDSRYEVYLPMLRRVEITTGAEPQVREEPLDKGLLFMRSSLSVFRELLQSPLLVPGMTPYYNHFHTNEFGKNEYLIVPDRQMESFRIIVESRNQDILVSQTEMPKLVEGDHVLVTDGSFAGVEGVVMKYKHQKRVFVQIQGVGIYATAYVPSAWLKKIDN